MFPPTMLKVGGVGARSGDITGVDVAGLDSCLGPLVSKVGMVSVLEIDIWLLSWACPVDVAGLGGETGW